LHKTRDTFGQYVCGEVGNDNTRQLVILSFRNTSERFIVEKACT